MIDTYHCPKCEGVVSIDDYELPVFQCDDCIVRKPIFGCGSEEFDMVFTFCVDSAGRCFDPAEHLFEPDDESGADRDSDPDPCLN